MYFKINSFFKKENNQYINLRNKTIRMLCGYEAFEDDQILNRIQVLVDYHREERIRLSVEPKEVKERLDKWRRWALNNIS